MNTVLYPGYSPTHIPMLNDEQALSGLKALDRQVIGAIYDQYFQEVYRYAYYRVTEKTLAEDIASDVFLRLLEASEAGKGPKSNLKGWLISTASHIATDYFRKKYRASEEEISDNMQDDNQQPAAEVDQREETRKLEDAYKSLSPEQMEVITLRFKQGYSLEETAAIMKKNINAVKALQFRALAALSREIGEVDL